MPRTELLRMSMGVASDLPLNTQVVDTGVMGGCITVVLKTAVGVRAQHCAGGIAALQHNFWDIARGDPTARAVIVGVPIGDQERIDGIIANCGVPFVVHLPYSRALVHIPLLSGNSPLAVSMCVVRR